MVRRDEDLARPQTEHRRVGAELDRIAHDERTLRKVEDASAVGVDGITCS